MALLAVGTWHSFRPPSFDSDADLILVWLCLSFYFSLLSYISIHSLSMENLAHSISRTLQKQTPHVGLRVHESVGRSFTRSPGLRTQRLESSPLEAPSRSRPSPRVVGRGGSTPQPGEDLFTWVISSPPTRWFKTPSLSPCIPSATFSASVPVACALDLPRHNLSPFLLVPRWRYD